jgi:hypothetical protein
MPSRSLGQEKGTEDQKVARQRDRKAAKWAERLAKRRAEVSAWNSLHSKRDAESLSGTRKGTEDRTVAGGGR